MRLPELIKLWAKVNDIDYATLAKEWSASQSTVTRFLADEQMPNGQTTARIIGWLMEDKVWTPPTGGPKP